MVEIGGETSRVSEALDRGSRSPVGDDGGLGVSEVVERDEEDRAPDGERDERVRALEEVAAQPLDTRYHATLHTCCRTASCVPVAYNFMLYVSSNYQGRLIFQSSPPVNKVPKNLNKRGVFHQLQPLPHFLSSHAGYRSRYYR